MIKATIYEAKTNLSELLKKAQRVETIVITSGRGKTPVAKLEAMKGVSGLMEMWHMHLEGLHSIVRVLPPDRYAQWRDINPLRFDPRQMMGQ